MVRCFAAAGGEMRDSMTGLYGALLIFFLSTQVNLALAEALERPFTTAQWPSEHAAAASRDVRIIPKSVDNVERSIWPYSATLEHLENFHMPNADGYGSSADQKLPAAKSVPAP